MDNLNVSGKTGDICGYKSESNAVLVFEFHGICFKLVLSVFNRAR